MTVASTTELSALPNEIIISILSRFPTLELLSLSLTSRRIHCLILRILHNRLLVASALAEHQIILECFHPSTKRSTPYLLCEYVGTSTISTPEAPKCAGEASEDDRLDEEQLSLGQLNTLYSHFRPLKPDSDLRDLRAHPAGGWFTIPPNSNALVNEVDSELVSQNIHLESHELFSQLCTITNLVKAGPRRGLFFSCVNITEGIVRVWRDWLAERCKPEETSTSPRRDRSRSLLWVGPGEHVGLRLRVKLRGDVPAPVLVSNGDDEPVSYTLQYEELVVRTTQLLLKVEQSLVQEVQHSGKAIVIGSCYCGLEGELIEPMCPTEEGGNVFPESMSELWMQAREAFGYSDSGSGYVGGFDEYGEF